MTTRMFKTEKVGHCDIKKGENKNKKRREKQKYRKWSEGDQLRHHKA